MTPPVNNAPVCFVCEDPVDVNDPNTIPHDGGEAHRIHPDCLREWLYFCREERSPFSCPDCDVIVGVDVPNPLENPALAIVAASKCISMTVRRLAVLEVLAHFVNNTIIALIQNDLRGGGPDVASKVLEWKRQTLLIVNSWLASGPLSEEDRGAALITAAHSGDIEIIDLFASGPVSEKDRGTVVKEAAKDGGEATVKACLRYGSISKEDLKDAVLNALGFDHEGIVIALLANERPSPEHLVDMLAMAMTKKSLVALNALLGSGSISEEDRTALVGFASKNGHGAMVQPLLDNGPIDVDTALKYAAKYGDTTTLRALLDKGPIDALSLLVGATEATENNQAAALQLLLDSGFLQAPIPLASLDMFPLAALAAAADLGHEAVLNVWLASDYISEKNRGFALTKATNKGHEAIVHALLSSGPIPQEYREEAVKEAARQNLEAILLALLNNGPISEETFIDAAMTTTVKNCKEALYALLERGTIPQQLRGLWVEDAVARGYESVMSALLANGPISQKSLGRAVILATSKGYGLFVGLLLAHGSLAPEDLEVAKSIARENNYELILNALLCNEESAKRPSHCIVF
ncbi:MAG: hypothetical protein KGJ02_01895 [Verrucomicrobiota bacterium]|nr:hypothetical protein [Verrucomicrobiota bacterium]